MNDKKRLFGTDGVRGIANRELTCEMAFGLGAAAVRLLGSTLVIGRDTRISGSMLEAALIAGITSRGGKAVVAGIIPTPAVALITRQLGADGGVVISASHNPPEYNGIKFFNADGFKISQKQEDALERGMRGLIDPDVRSGSDTNHTDSKHADTKHTSKSRSGINYIEELPTGEALGRAELLEDAHERYIYFAKSIFEKEQLTLKGLKIVVDCGNGAACYSTPETFRRLGAEVVTVNDEGEGALINVDSGSTNLRQVAELVLRECADIGIAHDGDADRVLAVSSSGAEIDGDYIEAICALDRMATRGIPGNTLVSTIMCNIGFIQGMEKAGLKVVQTPVGDSHVLAAMREGGYAIGGEQSGHTIFLEHNTTGDGLITALMLLAAMQRSGKSLDTLAEEAMQKYPQTLINIKVTDKHQFEANKAIAAAIQDAEHVLQKHGGGRVLVRASGTEPLVRVMVEARDKDIAERIARDLGNMVESELT